MSNNRSWLLIAEYVTVAGSVIGSAIAVFSQQVIYGLAPVSLSLLLNLMNRRQLEQQIQQSSAASSQVQELKSAINTLSVANAKIQQDVQNIAPNQELTSIASKVEAAQPTAKWITDLPCPTSIPTGRPSRTIQQAS
jgi:hypothetical protein